MVVSAGDLGMTRPLLVADSGIRNAGHLEHVIRLLTAAGLDVEVFEPIWPLIPIRPWLTEVWPLPQL